MANIATEKNLSVGAATVAAKAETHTILRTSIATLVLIGLLAGAYLLHATPGRGATTAFLLLTGVALGILFELLLVAVLNQCAAAKDGRLGVE